MPGAATITQFQGQTPPWSLISLDANFSALNTLMKDVGNYSTYIADAGGANAYSCTYGASLTFSLATGVKVVFKAANANTGASTLNVNATGIKNILNVDGSALTANQIVANGIYTAVYDGTQYQLLNPTQGIVNRNSVITGALSLAGNLTWATDNTYDIGASGANRARDLFLGRNAAIGGTLGVTGATTLSSTTSFGGNVVSDLLFTDATYDIGKSGATRPRDGFFSRNMTAGGNLVISGTGPHAIGGTTLGDVQLRLTGAYSGATTNLFGIYSDPTLTIPANGEGSGLKIAATLNKAGSGTHLHFSSVDLAAPTIGAGAGALTNATTLLIRGAPSVGTNQRSFWVAAGSSEFAGNVTLSSGQFLTGSNGGSASNPTYAGGSSNNAGLFFSGTNIRVVAGGSTVLQGGDSYAGSAQFPNMSTTASAANVFVDNAASNSLLRVTSSLRYKTDLEPLTLDEAVAVVAGSRAFSYASTSAADDPKRRFLGFGAEEIAKVDDRLLHYSNEDSLVGEVLIGGELYPYTLAGAARRPEAVQYERYAVVHNVVLQDLIEFKSKALEAFGRLGVKLN